MSQAPENNVIFLKNYLEQGIALGVCFIIFFLMFLLTGAAGFL